MNFNIVIPARYGSTRLPAKALMEIAGKPMIQHVYERACESEAKEIIIATDDERVIDKVSSFTDNVCLTDINHNSGTERITEVSNEMGWKKETVIVNLQGDEPLMPASLINDLANTLQHSKTRIATLATLIHHSSELFNPNVVKVVLDREDNALLFSRAPIPWDRNEFREHHVLPGNKTYYRHIGMYAYRVSFLRDYVTWPVSVLEKIESLEQLRVLWHGEKISVAKVREAPPHGVDTQADFDVVAAILAKKENENEQRK